MARPGPHIQIVPVIDAKELEASDSPRLLHPQIGLTITINFEMVKSIEGFEAKMAEALTSIGNVFKSAQATRVNILGGLE